MKKRIIKIWGLGLTLVLAASLLFSAIPASAGTLSWSKETIPSTTGNVIGPDNVDIVDLAVAADGQTMWAVTGTTASIGLYKSTDAGATWTKITNPTGVGTSITGVAIAPDDANLVAIIADTIEVYVTTNGGSTWGDLGTVQQPTYGAAAALLDIAISPNDSGTHYVAVAGNEAGPVANIWYFNVGAAAPAWKETHQKDGVAAGFDATGNTNSVAGAVAFSPNFASDKVMVAITEGDDGGVAADYVKLEIFSFASRFWNGSAGFTGYAVQIETGTAYTGLTAASLSVSPEYLGSDDSLRIAFAGLDITSVTDDDGLYRLSDTSVKGLKTGVDIASVAYNGTNLVAGEYDSNIVYRSADPLASTPTVSSASSLKRPGQSGTTTSDKVIVAWAGTNVVAGTSNQNSAFSVSTDNGKTFNDISLIDHNDGTTDLYEVEDIAVSADGSVVYMATNDGADFSLWRYSGAWQRVLSYDGVTNFIVRVAPDNANVVYVAGQGTTTLYYSNDGGTVKWFNRIAAEAVQDIAVESVDVLYIIVDGSANVRKSTNAGFTWASAKATGVTISAELNMIRSLGTDLLIVGSDNGWVGYSKDGNANWTKIDSQVNGSATAVQVTASGLATDSFIYAGSAATGQNIVRWKIGTSTSWSDIISGTLTTAAGDLPASTAMGCYGLVLKDGVLYALASDGTDSGVWRTLSPSTATSTSIWSYKLTADADNVALDRGPQGLFASSGSTKLWALDTDNDKLYSFLDTLSVAGPTLTSPRNGEVIKVNIVSGGTYTISVTWSRLSDASNYDIEFALDSAFNEVVLSDTKPSTSSTVAYVAVGTTFNPENTYYWHVRVASAGPLFSPWSEYRAFTIAKLPEPVPPVVIEKVPPPVISIPPAPAPPAITLQPPAITLPQPTITLPQPTVVLPPAPAPVAPIPNWTLLAIIIIGAVLVIALIVLIVRTRRPA